MNDASNNYKKAISAILWDSSIRENGEVIIRQCDLRYMNEQQFQEYLNLTIISYI